jgi:hypothetical protein
MFQHGVCAHGGSVEKAIYLGYGHTCLLADGVEASDYSKRGIGWCGGGFMDR